MDNLPPLVMQSECNHGPIAKSCHLCCPCGKCGMMRAADQVAKATRLKGLRRVTSLDIERDRADRED